MVDTVALGESGAPVTTTTTTTTSATPSTPVTAPTFELTYISPAEDATHVVLTCQESTQAKGTAFCQGSYQIAPVVGARAGYAVDVKCEILFGAASGPGCVTVVKDSDGPQTQKVIAQHLYPTSGVGPAYLASWEQKYLNFLRRVNLDQYDSLTSRRPVSPQPRGPGLVTDRMSFPSDRDLKTEYLEQEQIARTRDIMSVPKSSSPACARTDFKCRVLRLEMLTPPAVLEPVANSVPDLCTPASLCGSWRHYRNFVSREFSKKLNNGSFRLGTFQSDADSLWSRQGAKLWLEAQNIAADKQKLGPTYLAQMQMKTTLSLLAETRNLRLEQLDNSAMLWIYVLGLGIPGVLLTALYMSITCRTFWKTRKNTQLRKRIRQEEEREILRAARPGLQLKVVPEKGRLLNNGKPA